MTPAQLEEIRARCDAATPGPWISCEVESVSGRRLYVRAGSLLIGETWYADDREQVRNNEFVANARADVPALLAEVERLRSALALIDESCLGDLDEVRGVARRALEAQA